MSRQRVGRIAMIAAMLIVVSSLGAGAAAKTAAVPASPSVKPSPQCTSKHRVLANDSWTRLAARFRVPQARLLRLNSASLTTPLFIGDTVCLAVRSTSSSGGGAAGSSATTTTTVAPQPSARSLVLRPFAPLATSLSSAQRQQVIRFATTLAPGENVTCIGGAGSGPLQLLRDLARLRAEAVCSLIAKRNSGVSTTIDVIIRGEVQVTDRREGAERPAKTAPQVYDARDLQRRVLVVARPER